MFVIIGIVVVTVGVIVGYLVAGGNLILLIQVSEFITIGAAAIGSLLIASPLSLIKSMISSIKHSISHKAQTKEDYISMLKSFSDLFLIAQREGLLAIEKHIEAHLNCRSNSCMFNCSSGNGIIRG